MTASHYAVQRHDRENLKDLDLGCAEHTATPCAVKRKKEDNARADESKVENEGDQGLSTIGTTRVTDAECK